MSSLRVAVVTGTRADYGLLRPTIAALHDDARFELQLIVAAMHLDPLFGETVHDVEADPWPIAERVPIAAEGSLGERIAEGVAGFAGAFSRLGSEFLVLLGDRHEMLSAALAASGLELPIMHLHGGELSEGSLDDPIRHCITKLAHVHLVAAQEYADRVRQLGEEPWRVHVVGPAALESIRTLPLLERDELARELGGVALDAPLVALTLHPESLDPAAARELTSAVEAAAEDVIGDEGTVVITLPNDDPGNAPVREVLSEMAKRHDRVHAFPSLGQVRYLSLLRHADVVLGNSSSALLEAPAFDLPAVNVGRRQDGRIKPPNVIDTPATRAAIADALGRALDPSFRASLAGRPSPYGDGEVSRHVIELLADAPPPAELRRKRFVDLPGALR